MNHLREMKLGINTSLDLAKEQMYVLSLSLKYRIMLYCLSFSF